MAKKIEVSAAGVKQIEKLAEKLSKIQTKVSELGVQLGDAKLTKALVKENAAAEALYMKLATVLERAAE